MRLCAARQELAANLEWLKMNNKPMRSTLRMTKALADIQRVRILMLLHTGELCVCQIIAVLQLAPSTVSKHLSILSSAGLVDFRKDGRWAYYCLARGSSQDPPQTMLKLVHELLKADEMIAKDIRKLKSVLACDPGSLCRQQRVAKQE